jgi:hypothetical protein
LVIQAVLFSTALHPKNNYVDAGTIAKRAEALIGMTGIENDEITAVMHKLVNAIRDEGHSDQFVDVRRTKRQFNGYSANITSFKIHDAINFTGSDAKTTLISMGYELEDIESFLVC